jgi:hypothetical protein
VSRLRLVALGILLFAAPSSAGGGPQYYSLSGGGLQFQIGSERPMPIQPVPTTGGKFPSPGKQIATMTVFPTLLIPVNPDPAKALVQQTSGPDPKQITVPPGAFHRPAPGPMTLGVARFNPKLLQVRTNIEISAPAPALGPVVLKAGGRTGPPLMSVPGINIGDVVKYRKTAAQFGGPLRARLAAASPIREFAHGPKEFAKLPCKHPAFGGLDVSCHAQLLAEYLGTLAVIGAPLNFITTTPGGPPPMSPNVVNASIPNITGLIAKSATAAVTGTYTNMATSQGFPWTTGMITISAVEALGDSEQFRLTGMDSRVNGIGTISLVSGAFSIRKFNGPNGNRGWLRLTVPEPGAAISAAAALAVVAVCHGVARKTR